MTNPVEAPENTYWKLEFFDPTDLYYMDGGSGWMVRASLISENEPVRKWWKLWGGKPEVLATSESYSRSHTGGYSNQYDNDAEGLRDAMIVSAQSSCVNEFNKKVAKHKADLELEKAIRKL